MVNVFDEFRSEFTPYGLTCEMWTPKLMRKPDRHNEIELNFFIEGSISYLFQGNLVTMPPKKLAMFWGLVPHQIVSFLGDSLYYVCTVPISMFLEWNLPPKFVDKILAGEVLIEASEGFSNYDEFLFKNWVSDLKSEDHLSVAVQEIRGRLSRFALDNISCIKKQPSFYKKDISHVEKMAMYIAKNYSKPIRISEIGKSVDLHPDYANSIFKKTFGCTLVEFIAEERISHAQRNLVTSDMSITEIAFDCGFNSISRFNAAFLKIANCTPRKFRSKYH